MSSVVTPPASPTIQPPQQQPSNLVSNLGTAIALLDFPGQEDTDLSFHHGDVIEVMERIDDDWLKGRIGGREGQFPAAFVDISGF